MTIITREWLQQTIAEFENTRDDIPFGLDDDDAKILKVLKQALASFEAEPVGEFYHEKQDGWYQISEGDKVPDNRRIPLYTAPPVPAASSESVSQSLTDALRDVIAERQRQVSVKGWTPEHDDTYTCGELSGAAISYIEPMEAVFYWPAEWHDDSFKPSDERRNLVKATALLLAEIERLDRISAASALSEVSDGKARED
ncbi:hypothetical protein ACFN9U_000663 [Salmonella enterica]